MIPRLLLRSCRPLIFLIFIASALPAKSQTHYDMSRIKSEKLNRGLVAFRSGGKVVLSWRYLSADGPDKTFNILRNGKKLNTTPLKESTFFVDDNPLPGDVTYSVDGCDYKLKAGSPDGYLPIPISKPVTAMTQRDWRSGEETPVVYSANDASVGDVDGDGQYEIFLKWDPSNSRDNSMAGMTAPVYIDCYRLSGERLWRICLGRNIRAGAHYTQFLVYDFDGDGRAELMMKTADGTTDGIGGVIGDSTKDWRSHNQGATYGRIMDGPEYLSVFDGLTGRVLKTVDYIPGRGANGSWGDDHANRSERYLAAVAYLDGEHPSAVFCRGYYTRTVLAAWDWDGKRLTQHWVFDTDNPQWADYAGQGNHNLRTADVDGDGCDEITYGSMCVDHDGTGLYNTRFGHGDAIHLVADPLTQKLYIWDVHENRRDGSDFRDAATGKVVFQRKADFDVGRGMAADIDPTNYGAELWSANTGGLLNIKGERVKAQNYEEPSMQTRHKPGLSCNFSIWWDGDTLRELLDHETITKYNWVTGNIDVVKKLDGEFNNWTKSNPCLSADIIGDWREEVLLRNHESTELRLYISDIHTTYRLPCLMEDIPYRESVATENVGYNQPPEMGRTITYKK